jgi:hypothetical protein
MRAGRGHGVPGDDRDALVRSYVLVEVAWHSFFRFAKYSLPRGRFKHYSSPVQHVKVG